jgi:hypothetical protein
LAIKHQVAVAFGYRDVSALVVLPYLLADETSVKGIATLEDKMRSKNADND